MATYLSIHPDNPQSRLFSQAAVLCKKEAALGIYPTDSGYALGARLGDKKGLQRLATYCKQHKRRFLTLLCPDIRSISAYAHVDNTAFKYIKARTPGPYTFILRPRHCIVKQGLPYKRQTLGVRITNTPALLGLLSILSEPLMSVSLQPSSVSVHTEPAGEAQNTEDIGMATLPSVTRSARALFAQGVTQLRVDLMLSVGDDIPYSTTVVDLMVDPPVVLR